MVNSFLKIASEFQVGHERVTKNLNPSALIDLNLSFFSSTLGYSNNNKSTKSNDNMVKALTGEL